MTQPKPAAKTFLQKRIQDIEKLFSQDINKDLVKYTDQLDLQNVDGGQNTGQKHI